MVGQLTPPIPCSQCSPGAPDEGQLTPLPEGCSDPLHVSQLTPQGLRQAWRGSVDSRGGGQLTNPLGGQLTKGVNYGKKCLDPLHLLFNIRVLVLCI